STKAFARAAARPFVVNRFGVGTSRVDGVACRKPEETLNRDRVRVALGRLACGGLQSCWPGAEMTAARVRFDQFELDAHRYTLSQAGGSVKLERIPLELLLVLVERKGELVTRDQIIERLWGKDVFVDTDNGINTAIRKIRQALKDDAEESRFVQTVPAKGYRFIAPVAPVDVEDTAAPKDPENEFGAERSTHGQSRFIHLTVAALAVTGLAVVWIVTASRSHIAGSPVIRSLAVLPLENVTGDPSQDYFSDGMTDVLITDLAQIRALRVVSRTSSMRFKGTRMPLQEIARDLGVD